MKQSLPPTKSLADDMHLIAWNNDKLEADDSILTFLLPACLSKLPSLLTNAILQPKGKRDTKLYPLAR